ncbi:MAG: hypothetical protein N3D80_13910 [Ignavibacterium album]|uniref:hypothetical protein n=1 Tax=Ignavibacterium album TaxID=591197 RepID=UPI0026F1FF70|nr:hypothetical protein [Ignavibacterium album]MCX8106958.1 hypothetical protein [Ignavibacterium album]
MRSSINLTKKIFELTNRPFIGIKKSEIHFVANGHLNPMFTYFNFGNVPAKEINIGFSVVLDSKKIYNSNFTIDNIFPQNSILWANTLNSDFKGMFTVKNTFDLFMKITYRGVTDEIYSTEECYRYNSLSDDFKIIISKWD